MQIFTVIIDKLSLQNLSSAQRKQALEKRIFPAEDPAVVAARKAEQLRAEKEAAEKKAAEEKAAAEKAAAEKARAEAKAARKKRRSGKIGTKFIPGQYGKRVRDSRPAPSPAGSGTEKQTENTPPGGYKDPPLPGPYRSRQPKKNLRFSLETLPFVPPSSDGYCS